MKNNPFGKANNPDIERDKLWMAYLDGELSPTEAMQFDAAFSEVTQDRLAREMRLESALGDVLREDAACPEQVWNQTLQQLQAAEDAARKPARENVRRFKHRIWPFLSAAAAVLLLSMGYLSTLFLQPEPAFAISATDLESFAQSASVPPDHEEIEQLLAAQGFTLTLQEANRILQGAPHPTKMLGACHVHCHGMMLVQILFSCCEEPVKIVVAPRESKAAAMMLEGGRGTQIRATRELGDYRVALVGAHGREELLDLLRVAPAKTADSGRSLDGQMGGNAQVCPYARQAQSEAAME